MLPACALLPLPYHADPAVLFERVRHAPGAMLLDSGRPTAERGRYDLISAWPVEILTPMPGENGRDFLGRARRALHALGPASVDEDCDLPFLGGLLGHLSYDFGHRLDAASGHTRASASHAATYAGPRALSGSGPQSGGSACAVEHEDADPADTALPDARLGLYDWALVTDHQRHSTTLVFHPACPAGKRQRLAGLFATPGVAPTAVPSSSFSLEGPFRSAVDRETYRDAIARIHRYIGAGDCYQVNYTQRFEAAYRGDPWLAYCALRKACPTPFSGFVGLGGDNAILSLSPERFIRLTQRQIETRPIKGTRPRGGTPADDRAQAQQLLASTKDRAENLMIVDLLRNDIGRSSRIGSVHVPELFSLESYPNVHHLVSCVRAELAEGLDAFDLLAGSFPGGSITGAPKLRAMQIIAELEPHRRSVYCGSLLYVDVRGEMDSSITIRSLLAHEGCISCWGGGGIVSDSGWREEYQESLDKVAVLMKTLEGMGEASGFTGPDFT